MQFHIQILTWIYILHAFLGKVNTFLVFTYQSCFKQIEMPLCFLDFVYDDDIYSSQIKRYRFGWRTIFKCDGGFVCKQNLCCSFASFPGCDVLMRFSDIIALIHHNFHQLPCFQAIQKNQTYIIRKRAKISKGRGRGQMLLLRKQILLNCFVPENKKTKKGFDGVFS